MQPYWQPFFNLAILQNGFIPNGSTTGFFFFLSWEWPTSLYLFRVLDVLQIHTSREMFSKVKFSVAHLFFAGGFPRNVWGDIQGSFWTNIFRGCQLLAVIDFGNRVLSLTFTGIKLSVKILTWIAIHRTWQDGDTFIHLIFFPPSRIKFQCDEGKLTAQESSTTVYLKRLFPSALSSRSLEALRMTAFFRLPAFWSL